MSSTRQWYDTPNLIIIDPKRSMDNENRMGGVSLGYAIDEASQRINEHLN